MEPDTPSLHVDIDACLYCVHYNALGCSGRIRFCTFLNLFLLDDPTQAQCAHREPIEGSA